MKRVRQAVLAPLSLTKTVEPNPRTKKRIRVWTDGACRGNGKKRPRAGCGAFFGVGDPRNVSEPLPGALQTNQRAEMFAAIRALEVLRAEPAAPVQLITDSKYVIKGVTEWIAGWKRRGWLASSGKPVKNRDLWERLDRLASARTVHWTHVKGHSGDPGNEAADALATRAADDPRALKRRKAEEL